MREHREMPLERYYRNDLARIHHEAFGAYGDSMAPGVLDGLSSLERGSRIVEVGCGSGRLTRELCAAGFDVVATDSSVAMLELAASFAPEATFGRLTLPEDPIPDCDAIVGVGHPLNYVDSDAEIEASLRAMGSALAAGGVLITDLCGLGYAAARRGAPPSIWRGEEWLLTCEYEQPDLATFVRAMSIFTKNVDGSWRRDDERHHNTLIDIDRVPAILAEVGVVASISTACGATILPEGMVLITGVKPTI